MRTTSISPAEGDPAMGLATRIGQELRDKVEAAIAAALGARLGLGRPATEDDVRGLRHRLTSVENKEQRWYYLDLEPLFGHTLPKATWDEASWSEDGSALQRRMTLECHSLPLEQALPFAVVRAAGLPVTCEYREKPVPAHQVSEDEDLDERGL